MLIQVNIILWINKKYIEIVIKSIIIILLLKMTMRWFLNIIFKKSKIFNIKKMLVKYKINCNHKNSKDHQNWDGYRRKIKIASKTNFS